MKQMISNKKIYSKQIIAGRFLPAIISFIILVLIDQLSKYFVDHYMHLGDSISIIPNIFEIYYIQNPGTAWGLLANQQVLFAICTFIVFFFGIKIYYRCLILDKYKDLRIILILILAGGLGNFIDRIRNQYVIDFLYFKLIHFPVFNVADCYVTIGMFLLLWSIFVTYKNDNLEDLFSKIHS